MKRKKVSRKGAQKCADCRYNKHSLVLGLLDDLWVVLRTLIKLLAWPCKALAGMIHAEMKKYPALRFRHSHAVLCVFFGLAVLALSFAVEAYFVHPAWKVPVETMRAAGVCPIWESLAALMRLGEDFGA